MSRSKKPKQRVTEYYMSIHFGICQGPVDTLSRIRVNEKVAWIGAQTNQGSFRIDNKGLFGGVKKEGGVQGQVYYQPGNFTQRLAAYVASKLGLTPDTAPGYRGIATAWFTENSASSRNGFYWSANQPYIPPLDFLVTRITRSWYPERAMIVGTPGFPLAVSFTIDNSGSMAFDGGVRLQSMKTAMNIALDRIQGAIQSTGLQIDIHVSRWGNTNYAELSYANATVANIATIRNFINNFSANSGGTDFAQAAQGAVNFFNTTLSKNLGSRSWIFITDGAPEPVGTASAAATVAADLLNQSSGQFNTGAGTQVDAYGINIALEDITYTQLLDNTPRDGVPVVSADDPSGLLNVIQNAIFGGVPPDINPAHIVYECLTNTAWGMGAPTSAIDDAAFRAAADTLFNEGFGMSMIWAQQTEIESFIQEVLDHIEANLYVDPRTGRFVLKLIRDDYDAETLPILDDSNSVLTSFSRRSPAEIVNEINVTWTNPDNEQEEVLTIQDLGGIVQSGGQIISDNRNYYGIRRKDLAWQVAQRDIATATAPLATGEIEVNRQGWDYVPGAVFKLRSEEHGVDDEIMRVVKIDYGKPGDSTITINFTQDIFSFERPVYEIPPETEFEGGGQTPEVFDETLVFTLNFFLTGYYVALESLFETDYPDAWTAILASTPNIDAQDFELLGPVTDPAGNVVASNLGTRSITSRGELAGALVREAQSVTPLFVNTTPGVGARVGAFGLIGPPGTPEDQMELVMFLSTNGSTWTVRRGVLDTVPRAWPAGTRIRFFGENSFIADQERRASFETVGYKALMRTSLELLGDSTAPLINYTVNERPFLPTRPANVRLNGAPWAVIDATSLTEIEATWANRNRVTEDAQIMAWNDPGITPEPSQTVEIDFVDEATGTVYNTIDGLTGESYTIPIAEFAGAGVTTLRFYSARNGFRSFTAHSQRVITASGYGNAYGLDYGGAF